MNCSKCGRAIPDAAAFCPICGNRVSRNAEKSPAPVSPASGGKARGKKNGKSAGKWIGLGIGGGILLLLIAAVTAVVLFALPLRISFDPGYGEADEKPETQWVKRGEYASEPEPGDREGFLFIGWYGRSGGALPYDFSAPVRRSEKLTAKWLDASDTADRDGDGLPDAAEAILGTDPDKEDTDGDGLSDGPELRDLGLDPLKTDTDGDGTPDGEEDTDGDGLTNLRELEIGTFAWSFDTDGDGLGDGDEINRYHTDPLVPDTDGDRVSDGREIAIGSDPLLAESSFRTVKTLGETSEVSPVAIEAAAVTDAAGAGTLHIETVAESEKIMLSSSGVGYLGPAYDISSEGTLESAVLTFTYDPSLGTPGDGFAPRVYWYDEENDRLVELPDQTVEEGCVTVRVEHFSIYTLRDKDLIDWFMDAVLNMAAPMLEDLNGDGLPDMVARGLSDGSILYDDSTFLVGVLDIYGEEDDDWDDDGLKNGEEIEYAQSWLGTWRIVIHSNPLLKDSDFDGIGDYAEIRQMHSNPVKYDRASVGALQQLFNDSAYSFTNYKRTWRENFANFFNFKKYDQAKECLIDYFYDYAPEDTIRKNAETIRDRAVFEKALKVVGALGNLAASVESVYSAVDDGTKLADLDDPYKETLEVRCNLLHALNDDARATVKTNEILAEMKMLTEPDKLASAVEKLAHGDGFDQFAGATQIIKSASAALKTYKACRDYELFDLTKYYDKCMKGSEALGRTPGKFNMTMTIVKDGIDLVEEQVKIFDTYSKIAANMDAYNLYTELLICVKDNADDGFVRDAARDLAKDIASNCTEAYFSDVSKAMTKQLLFSGMSIALDVLAEVHPVAKIIDVFLELYQYTGVTQMSKNDVYITTMAELTEGSKSILDEYVARNDYTFSYNADRHGDEVEKYLVQLAQCRVMGEYHWHEYCANHSAAGWLLAIYNRKNPDDYRDMGKNRILEVYTRADRLALLLSPNLPYYGETSHREREDELPEFADTYSLPASLNTFLSVFWAYNDAENGKEYDCEDIGGVSRSLLSKMLFNAPCADYDVYPGGAREEILNYSESNPDPRNWIAEKPSAMVYVYDLAKTRWIAKNIFHVPNADFETMLAAGEEERSFYVSDGKIYYFTYGIGWECPTITVQKVLIEDDVYKLVYSVVSLDGYWGYAESAADYFIGVCYAEMTYEKIGEDYWWTILKNSASIPERFTEDTWEEGYYDFILRGLYWGGEFFYAIDRYPTDYSLISFGLSDLDGDGIPELIGFSGGDDYASEATWVYAWRGGEVVPVGPLGGYYFKTSEDKNYPGLFEEIAHTGGYQVIYHWIENGELREEVVLSADARDGKDMTELDRTEDAALYAAWKKGGSEFLTASRRELLLSRRVWDNMAIAAER